jgi:hypothetical protein
VFSFLPLSDKKFTDLYSRLQIIDSKLSPSLLLRIPDIQAIESDLSEIHASILEPGVTCTVFQKIQGRIQEVSERLYDSQFSIHRGTQLPSLAEGRLLLKRLNMGSSFSLSEQIVFYESKKLFPLFPPGEFWKYLTQKVDLRAIDLLRRTEIYEWMDRSYDELCKAVKEGDLELCENYAPVLLLFPGDTMNLCKWLKLSKATTDLSKVSEILQRFSFVNSSTLCSSTWQGSLEELLEADELRISSQASAIATAMIDREDFENFEMAYQHLDCFVPLEDKARLPFLRQNSLMTHHAFLRFVNFPSRKCEDLKGLLRCLSFLLEKKFIDVEFKRELLYDCALTERWDFVSVILHSINDMQDCAYINGSPILSVFMRYTSFPIDLLGDMLQRNFVYKERDRNNDVMSHFELACLNGTISHIQLLVDNRIDINERELLYQRHRESAIERLFRAMENSTGLELQRLCLNFSFLICNGADYTNLIPKCKMDDGPKFPLRSPGQMFTKFKTLELQFKSTNPNEAKVIDILRENSSFISYRSLMTDKRSILAWCIEGNCILVLEYFFREQGMPSDFAPAGTKSLMNLVNLIASGEQRNLIRFLLEEGVPDLAGTVHSRDPRTLLDRAVNASSSAIVLSVLKAKRTSPLNLTGQGSWWLSHWIGTLLSGSSPEVLAIVRDIYQACKESLIDLNSFTMDSEFKKNLIVYIEKTGRSPIIALGVDSDWNETVLFCKELSFCLGRISALRAIEQDPNKVEVSEASRRCFEASIMCTGGSSSLLDLRSIKEQLSINEYLKMLEWLREVYKCSPQSRQRLEAELVLASAQRNQRKALVAYLKNFPCTQTDVLSREIVSFEASVQDILVLEVLGPYDLDVNKKLCRRDGFKGRQISAERKFSELFSLLKESKEKSLPEKVKLETRFLLHSLKNLIQNKCRLPLCAEQWTLPELFEVLQKLWIGIDDHEPYSRLACDCFEELVEPVYLGLVESLCSSSSICYLNSEHRDLLLIKALNSLSVKCVKLLLGDLSFSSRKGLVLSLFQGIISSPEVFQLFLEHGLDPFTICLHRRISFINHLCENKDHQKIGMLLERSSLERMEKLVKHLIERNYFSSLPSHERERIGKIIHDSGVNLGPSETCKIFYSKAVMRYLDKLVEKYRAYSLVDNAAALNLYRTCLEGLLLDLDEENPVAQILLGKFIHTIPSDTYQFSCDKEGNSFINTPIQFGDSEAVIRALVRKFPEQVTRKFPDVMTRKQLDTPAEDFHSVLMNENIEELTIYIRKLEQDEFSYPICMPVLSHTHPEHGESAVKFIQEKLKNKDFITELLKYVPEGVFAIVPEFAPFLQDKKRRFLELADEVGNPNPSPESYKKLNALSKLELRNLTCDGQTLLHKARSIEMIEFLMKLGLSCASKCDHGLYPIHYQDAPQEITFLLPLSPIDSAVTLIERWADGSQEYNEELSRLYAEKIFKYSNISPQERIVISLCDKGRVLELEMIESVLGSKVSTFPNVERQFPTWIVRSLETENLPMVNFLMHRGLVFNPRTDLVFADTDKMRKVFLFALTKGMLSLSQINEVDEQNGFVGKAGEDVWRGCAEICRQRAELIPNLEAFRSTLHYVYVPLAINPFSNSEHSNTLLEFILKEVDKVWNNPTHRPESIDQSFWTLFWHPSLKDLDLEALCASHPLPNQDRISLLTQLLDRKLYKAASHIRAKCQTIVRANPAETQENLFVSALLARDEYAIDYLYTYCLDDSFQENLSKLNFQRKKKEEWFDIFQQIFPLLNFENQKFLLAFIAIEDVGSHKNRALELLRGYEKDFELECEFAENFPLLPTDFTASPVLKMKMRDFYLKISKVGIRLENFLTDVENFSRISSLILGTCSKEAIRDLLNYCMYKEKNELLTALCRHGVFLEAVEEIIQEKAHSSSCRPVEFLRFFNQVPPLNLFALDSEARNYFELLCLNNPTITVHKSGEVLTGERRNEWEQLLLESNGFRLTSSREEFCADSMDVEESSEMTSTTPFSEVVSDLSAWAHQIDLKGKYEGQLTLEDIKRQLNILLSRVSGGVQVVLTPDYQALKKMLTQLHYHLKDVQSGERSSALCDLASSSIHCGVQQTETAARQVAESRQKDLSIRGQSLGIVSIDIHRLLTAWFQKYPFKTIEGQDIREIPDYPVHIPKWIIRQEFKGSLENPSVGFASGLYSMMMPASVIFGASQEVLEGFIPETDLKIYHAALLDQIRMHIQKPTWVLNRIQDYWREEFKKPRNLRVKKLWSMQTREIINDFLKACPKIKQTAFRKKVAKRIDETNVFSLLDIPAHLEDENSRALCLEWKHCVVEEKKLSAEICVALFHLLSEADFAVECDQMLDVPTLTKLLGEDPEGPSELQKELDSLELKGTAAEKFLIVRKQNALKSKISCLHHEYQKTQRKKLKIETLGTCHELREHFEDVLRKLLIKCFRKDFKSWAFEENGSPKRELLTDLLRQYGTLQ